MAKDDPLSRIIPPSFSQTQEGGRSRRLGQVVEPIRIIVVPRKIWLLEDRVTRTESSKSNGRGVVTLRGNTRAATRTPLGMNDVSFGDLSRFRMEY